MKAIPKKELIEILKEHPTDIIFESDINCYFYNYGDDYYKESSWGNYELCKANDKRKSML